VPVAGVHGGGRFGLDDLLEPQEPQSLLLPRRRLRVDMESALVDLLGWHAEGNHVRPTAEKRDGITVLKMRSDLLPRSFDQMAKRRPGEQYLDNAHAASLVTTNDRLGHAPTTASWCSRPWRSPRCSWPILP
jgi:hypothetical protein